MGLSGFLLRLSGWTVEAKAPKVDKCLICVAPHTSNWDFLLGELAYTSVGRKAGFLMKDTWFFFPLGYLLRAIGGIPVPRKYKRKGGSLVDEIVKMFDQSKQLHIAITPEGTRSRTCDWKTGFLRIAYQAHVPCQLAVIDYATKHIMVNDEFWPTGDIEADMRAIKDYYKPFKGKNPEKFCTD